MVVPAPVASGDIGTGPTGGSSTGAGSSSGGAVWWAFEEGPVEPGSGGEDDWFGDDRGGL